MMSPNSGRESGKDNVRQPIGTGPFVFKEWIPMEKTVIAVNSDYYGAGPKLKDIVWKYIAEPSTRIVELKAGTADIINKVLPELVGGISGKKSKVVRKQSLYRFGIKLNCSQAPFDNIKVRQAFNYATKKEEIIKYVLRGAGYIATGPLGPDRQGHNPDLKPYPHDPAKAKKLLAEAGYSKGLDIEILSPHGRYLKDKEITEAISYQVKEVGINMKVKPLEWGMFLKQFKTSQGFFVASGHRDAQKLFFVTGDSRSKAYSWMGYHNDEWMKLYDEAAGTFDIEKRNAIYRKIAKIEWEDAPWVWLYYSQDIYGVSNRVKNFEPRGDGFLILNNVSV